MSARFKDHTAKNITNNLCEEECSWTWLGKLLSGLFIKFLTGFVICG